MHRNKTLVIVDDQFERMEGHPYEYNKSVAEIFREKGHAVVIYGQKKIPVSIQEELGVIPWFSFNSTSAIRKIPIMGAIIYRYRFNKSYRHQMRALIKKLSSDFSDNNYILFVPNAYWYNILAIACSFRYANTPCAFLFRVSIFDTIRIAQVMKPFIFPLIKNAVKILKQNRLVYHFSDSEVIAKEWKKTFWHPMHVLPIPHLSTLDHLPTKYNTDNKIRLFLPGSLRLEKGAVLLTESMEKLIAEYPHYANRIVLVTQFSDSNPEIIQYRTRLVALGFDNIILGNLSSKEYYKQFGEADVILIPYKLSEGYRARTSGILAEALAAQKPVLTTEGTWMAAQLEKYHCGVVVDENVNDFIRGLIDIIDNYPLFLQKAQEASKSWLEFHSKENFYRTFTNALNV